MEQSKKDEKPEILRCKKCAMPETVLGIHFNEDGICNFCQSFVPYNKYLGEEKLAEEIALARKKNNKYDCVVPLSGGRDSSYILYLAKVKYNLKVLAVNYDNEFTTEQARLNMKNACQRLNVELISVRSKRNVARKMVYSYLRFASKIGLNTLTVVMCNACVYGGRSSVYRAAEKYQVPLILWGDSPDEFTGNMQANLKIQQISRRAYLQRRLFDINSWKAEFYQLLQRLEFPVPRHSVFSRKYPTLKNKDIKELRIFYYIPWDRRKIKETITRELGWQKPPDAVSSWRTDCLLHPLANYSFYKIHGCTKDCFGYCNMINTGQMTREEALEQEVKLAAETKNIRKLLKDDIGLTDKEADKIESLSKLT